MRYPKIAFVSTWVAGVLGVLLLSSPAFGQEDMRSVIQSPYDPFLYRVPAPNFLAPGPTGQFANPYPILNLNHVQNPVVVTPVNSIPIVPSPVVPNLNFAPNGPWSPGYVVPITVP